MLNYFSLLAGRPGRPHKETQTMLFCSTQTFTKFYKSTSRFQKCMWRILGLSLLFDRTLDFWYHSLRTILSCFQVQDSDSCFTAWLRPWSCKQIY